MRKERILNWARAFFGTVILAVGVVLLLDNLDMLDAGDVISRWWPAPLVLGGLMGIAANPRHWVPPAILTAGAGAVLLKTTGVVDSFGAIVPILLILLGVFVIAGRGFGTARNETGDSVNSFNMFSGSELASHSTAFSGGRIGAVFGGAEIDLRDAVPVADASIDVFVAFGGVELRVPEGWRVDIFGLPLFGGFENATSKERLPENAPRLRIDATVLFGGLEVKH